MLRRCVNCKNSSVYYNKKTCKLVRVWCNKIGNEITLKRYNKMRFCLYHELKEDW